MGYYGGLVPLIWPGLVDWGRSKLNKFLCIYLLISLCRKLYWSDDTSYTFDTHIGIYYFWHICLVSPSNMTYLTFMSYWRWHMKYMSKVIYANMVVKSSVGTSTIRPAAPKMSKVHFNILNLKYEKNSNFLCIFWNILCIFHVYTWPLVPPSTKAKMFKRTCLQSHL
jgi:hypothetical protein